MNKRGICTIFVIVTLVVFGIIGCDYAKWMWNKIEGQGCKGILAVVKQTKKQLVSHYDAKRPECIDELPVIKHCVATGEYLTAKSGEVDACKMIMDEMAKSLSKNIAKRCEANYDKLYKDIKNSKELCNALIAIGFLK